MPKNFDDGGQADTEITREHIFAGADNDDELNEDVGDRGDEADPAVIAAKEAEDKKKEDEKQDDDDKDSKDDSDDSDDKTVKKDDDKSDDKDASESDDEDAGDKDAGDKDGDDKEDDEDDKVSPYVSKDRFNVVNERMKAAEQALAESKTKQPEAEVKAAPEAKAFDYDTKEMEYMELVNDGEYDKANAIRKDIRAAERAEIAADTTAATQESSDQVASQIDFSNKLTELNEEFDTFNPQHDDYDQTMVDEAVDRRDMFIKRGMTAADALDKAAREVAKLYDLPSKFEQMADEEIARQAAEDKKKTPAKKKADVDKKIEQANKQPSKMDEGSAINEGEKTALNMDDKEFDALPEATKARMRGDIV